MGVQIGLPWLYEISIIWNQCLLENGINRMQQLTRNSVIREKYRCCKEYVRRYFLFLTTE